jgi:chromosome segregation ATPase
MGELKDEKDSIQQNLNETKENLKQTTSDKNNLDKLVKQLRTDLKGWEAKYDECERSCQLQMKQKDLEVEAAKLDFEGKERKMRAELDRLLGENISEHEDHIAALMAELEELRRKFDEKIKFYEDQYRELQMCFEGRPSRPDDIELINNLQKECNTKNEELA